MFHGDRLSQQTSLPISADHALILFSSWCQYEYRYAFVTDMKLSCCSNIMLHKYHAIFRRTCIHGDGVVRYNPFENEFCTPLYIELSTADICLKRMLVVSIHKTFNLFSILLTDCEIFYHGTCMCGFESAPIFKNCSCY